MAVTYGGSTGTTYVAAGGITSNLPTCTPRQMIVQVHGQKPTSYNGGSFTHLGERWLLLTGVFPDTGAQNTGGYGDVNPAQDTGDMNFNLWQCIAAPGDSGRSLPISSSGGSVSMYKAFTLTSSTGYWAPTQVAWAARSTATTAISSALSGLTTQAGDMVVFGQVPTSDGATPYSAVSLSQSGATFSAATIVQNSGTSTGSDMGLFVAYADVTAGPGTGDLTVTATSSSTSARGPVFAAVFRSADAPTETRRGDPRTSFRRDYSASLRAVQ